jgi:hypothetical protein
MIPHAAPIRSKEHGEEQKEEKGHDPEVNPEHYGERSIEARGTRLNRDLESSARSVAVAALLFRKTG